MTDLGEIWIKNRPQNNGEYAKHPAPPPYYEDQDLTGKKILLWNDQGVGDEILCSSMLWSLLNQRAVITLECESRLVPVFRRSFPLVNVVERRQGGTDHDYQACLPDLGKILRPTSESFPTFSSYLWPDALEAINCKLTYREEAKFKPVIGISWRSSNHQHGDNKSASPADFYMLFGTYFLVSLQYGEVQHEINNLPIYYDRRIDQIQDLDSAFAQVAACDLVVTTSNTTAHIAGSQGRPTILLLPKDKDVPWYWFDGEQTPWYPSMRIFRGEGELWCMNALKKALDIGALATLLPSLSISGAVVST